MATDDSVIVYRSGVARCSVCVPAVWPLEKVEDEVNASNPTGIESRWRKAEDSTFPGGQPNPCDCEDDAERRHYLMEC